ncbi:xanthine dehydrogenase family protein molybdopterin-binding subunit [Rhodalgimonas zhirmunskyi]|uniref:Xanthine dehydrogenase family protein molybdopterin-binding subunit n=1 Tax=Rhodalgimonas zhirmunskyi TaxID=2964767 RepID=A0AAJ1UC02_9RHOB|nr:xanthine dehydrogenase family protein molybdopterin-binding subunit [Rhodoalgimonas zhirmunskyi]MDQ2095730.1 xanthine dehydrogenase family protein molybdopterin-binding subunit [Rhodoalgimonas zhirmunskyi]
MDKFGKSQSVKRVEDLRFLTGHGRYVDDIAPSGALHVWFLRSDVAHGVLGPIDVSEAQEAPGVHLVLDAAALAEAGVTQGMPAVAVKNRDGSTAPVPKRPLLAEGRVRHVGEIIAMVVADTLEQARDAAEMIWPEIDDLPAMLERGPGETDLHEEAPKNLALDWGLGDEAATAAAFEAAAHVVEMHVEDNRIIVASMEPRGAYAEVEDGRLHLAVNAQGVWVPKRSLADVLGMDAEDIRVTNPDTGGGFGMKGQPHPEQFLVAQAARMLNRPVRWMGSRSEAMISDANGRDLEHEAALAFDADYRITGYRVKTRHNIGAYCSQFAQLIQTQLFSRVLTGVYDIGATWLHSEGYYSNTVPVDAYRGAGRPEAIFLLERMMDRAARELGIDPLELRRRNFIKPEQFPFKALTGETIDVGDFDKVLTHAEQFADLAGFAARRAESEARGLKRGIGLCYYIESILGDPSEGARVVFNEDGSVTIFVGTQSNGQGHETVHAQFLSDQTGIPAEKIEVVQGDSDLIAQGGGTGGSRSVTTQSHATLATVSKMVAAFTPYLAEKMGVDEGDITFDDETFRAPGSNMTPTFLEAAEMARADGREDLLMHEERATLPGRSFPNGAHFAEVEVDPETGKVDLVRYSVVDDFGNLINPMLAEGQVHGGVVQGAGQALMEHVVFDESGQLLTASFMDYAIPRAEDMPMIGFEVEPVPSTANPMGMKGCGEAGTVGAMAALANAVQDALWDMGVRQADMPFTPVRTWKMMQDAMEAAG